MTACGVRPRAVRSSIAVLMTALAVLLGVALPVPASVGHYRHHGTALLNDLHVTPGSWRTEPLGTLCRPQRVLHVPPPTPAVRRRTLALYGITASAAPGFVAPGFTFDRLVPAGLGGDASARNVWPQPTAGFGAHRKDQLDARLRTLVCSHRLSLASARAAVTRDWVRAYATFVAPPPGPVRVSSDPTAPTTAIPLPGSPTHAGSPTHTGSPTPTGSPTRSPSPRPSASPVRSPGGAACGVATTVPSTYNHVVWIMLENKNQSDIIGNAHAPYETQVANACATAGPGAYTDLFHPSLPNYIALTSGDSQGVVGDHNPGDIPPITADNIFRQVRAAGGTAFSYEESMDAGTTCELSPGADNTAGVYRNGQYEPKHNPAAFYQGGNDRAACVTDNVPLGTLSSGALHDALASGTLPTFTLITPNSRDSSHDCYDCGDAFIKALLPAILDAPNYLSNDTAVFILWDESGAGGSDQPGIFIAPTVKPGTVLSSASPFDHYAVLRTTEDMLGISAHLMNAANASSLRTALNL